MLINALSVKQPWAYGIVHLGKKFENRNWQPTNRNRHFRGTCLIHASKSCTKDDEYDYGDMLWMGGHYPGLVPRPKLLKVPPFPNLERGGIIGICDVVGGVVDREIVNREKNIKHEWFVGPFALELDNVRPLPFTPCNGMLGFFQVDAGTLGLDAAIINATKNRITAGGYVRD